MSPASLQPDFIKEAPLPVVVIVMLPGCKMPEVGIREGEKLHEIMVTVEDSLNTYEYDKHFIVYPQMVWSESRRAVPTGKKECVKKTL